MRRPGGEPQAQRTHEANIAASAEAASASPAYTALLRFPDLASFFGSFKLACAPAAVGVQKCHPLLLVRTRACIAGNVTLIYCIIAHRDEGRPPLPHRYRAKYTLNQDLYRLARPSHSQHILSNESNLLIQLCMPTGPNSTPFSCSSTHRIDVMRSARINVSVATSNSLCGVK